MDPIQNRQLCRPSSNRQAKRLARVGCSDMEERSVMTTLSLD
jgi:hypothetical protein